MNIAQPHRHIFFAHLQQFLGLWNVLLTIVVAQLRTLHPLPRPLPLLHRVHLAAALARMSQLPLLAGRLYAFWHFRLPDHLVALVRWRVALEGILFARRPSSAASSSRLAMISTPLFDSPVSLVSQRGLLVQMSVLTPFVVFLVSPLLLHSPTLTSPVRTTRPLLPLLVTTKLLSQQRSRPLFAPSIKQCHFQSWLRATGCCRLSTGISQEPPNLAVERDPRFAPRPV